MPTLSACSVHKDNDLAPCRRLFAELQEGPKSSADPTSLAESLSLDRSVQQVQSLCCLMQAL